MSEPLNNQSKPKVCVVMPIFNMKTTIKETLDSLSHQRYGNMQIVIVDDGSTDGTLEIVDGYLGLPIEVIRQRHTGLPGAVRNVGLRNATGRFVQFLDADDLMDPDKISRQVAILLDCPFPDSTVAYSDYRQFVDTPEGRRTYRQGPADGHHWPDDLVTQFAMYTVIHRFLFPRQVVMESGAFDESLSHAEDLDLWLRLLILGIPFSYEAEPPVLYRQHRGHSVQDPEGERRSRLVVAKKVREYVRAAGCEDEHRMALATILQQELGRSGRRME